MQGWNGTFPIVQIVSTLKDGWRRGNHSDMKQATEQNEENPKSVTMTRFQNVIYFYHYIELFLTSNLQTVHPVSTSQISLFVILC